MIFFILVKCFIFLILDVICYVDYGILMEDECSNCQSWGLFFCDVIKICWFFKVWQFISVIDIWGVLIIGFQGIYGGGGYVVDLGIY